jgi:chromosome segregation ATPase
MPVMSELLQKTLAAFSNSDDTASDVAEVPVRQLESMAAKIAELEDRLTTQSGGERRLREHAKSLEAQLRSHQRSASVIATKYKEAIGDRGTFEHRAKIGEEKASKAQGALEASKVESETLRKKVKDLETQLAEAKAALEGSAIPNAAKVARAERELGEAQGKILSLEKKVANAERDTDYSRKAYQDASNAHSLLNQENQELRERVEILERKANENIVKINETNARYQDEAEQRQTDELRARLRECQRELALARDELRHLKNGRRETRQASVPRSPRTTGVMSPRPSRGGVGGGTGSRGTSPAPTYDAAGATGMVYLQQPPNSSRWGQHLRD